MDFQDYILIIQSILILVLLWDKKKGLIILLNHFFYLSVENSPIGLGLRLADKLFQTCNPFMKYGPLKSGFVLSFNVDSGQDNLMVELLKLDISGFDENKSMLSWKKEELNEISNSIALNDDIILSFKGDLELTKDEILFCLLKIINTKGLIGHGVDKAIKRMGNPELESISTIFNKYHELKEAGNIIFDTIESKTKLSFVENHKIGTNTCFKYKEIHGELEVKIDNNLTESIGFEVDAIAVYNLLNYLIEIEKCNTLPCSDIIGFGLFDIGHCLDPINLLKFKDKMNFVKQKSGSTVYLQASDKSNLLILPILAILATILQSFSNGSGLIGVSIYSFGMTFLLLMAMVSLQNYLKSTKIKYFTYVILKKFLSDNAMTTFYTLLKSKGSSFSFCDFRTFLPMDIKCVAMLKDRDSSLFSERFLNFLGELDCERQFYPIYGSKSWYFKDSSVVITREDYNYKEVKYSIVVNGVDGILVERKTWIVNKNEDKGYAFYSLMDEIKSGRICGVAESNSDLNFGISFSHFYSPVEIMEECLKTNNLRVEIAEINRAVNKRFLSASFKLGINKYLSLCKDTCFYDDRSSCVIAAFNCLFFGRFEADLAFNIKPNSHVVKRNFNVDNKLFKRYTSCLSNLFENLGYKKLKCLTKSPNFSDAYEKIMRILPNFEFEIEMVDSENMYAILNGKEYKFINNEIEFKVTSKDKNAENYIKFFEKESLDLEEKITEIESKLRGAVKLREEILPEKLGELSSLRSMLNSENIKEEVSKKLIQDLKKEKEQEGGKWKPKEGKKGGDNSYNVRLSQGIDIEKERLNKLVKIKNQEILKTQTEVLEFKDVINRENGVIFHKIKEAKLDPIKSLFNLIDLDIIVTKSEGKNASKRQTEESNLPIVKVENKPSTVKVNSFKVDKVLENFHFIRNSNSSLNKKSPKVIRNFGKRINLFKKTIKPFLKQNKGKGRVGRNEESSEPEKIYFKTDGKECIWEILREGKLDFNNNDGGSKMRKSNKYSFFRKKMKLSILKLIRPNGEHDNGTDVNVGVDLRIFEKERNKEKKNENFIINTFKSIALSDPDHGSDIDKKVEILSRLYEERNKIKNRYFNISRGIFKILSK